MSYHFQNIKPLYRHLLESKKARCIFTVKFNGMPFSCIFLIDVSPFRLYITSLGESPFSIELEVHRGFQVSSQLSREDYYKLVKYLGLKYDKNNPFKPNIFFGSIDQQIVSAPKRVPRYSEVISVVRRHRLIDEEKKIYFCNWRINPVGDKVRPKNLEKTRSAFGDEIAEMCQKNNISSCWTDMKEKEHLIKLNDFLSNVGSQKS